MEQTTQATGMDGYTDLALAATSIFGGVSSEVPLKSLNRVATIKPASMKQLPLVLSFFMSIMNNMDSETLGALVELVADRQKELLAQGKDPSTLPVEEIAGAELVHKAFGKVNLFGTLLSSVLEGLPKLAPAFSDVTEEEYGNLPPDEGMLLAGGIFMVNYSFFTQSLPPLLTAFVRGWASKNAPALVAAAPKRILKRK